MDWEEITNAVAACTRCPLCQRRTQTVLGEGSLTPALLLVGEGPGQKEDESGRPFVGPAGQLLDKMLHAISLKREEVYIANIVKCRPPLNRTPTPEEAQACLPYLRAQFLLLKPKFILCLGATPARTLISPDIRIFRDHGLIVKKKDVFFMPTFHPSALLRNPSYKKDAWEDLQKLKREMQKLDNADPSFFNASANAASINASLTTSFAELSVNQSKETQLRMDI